MLLIVALSNIVMILIFLTYINDIYEVFPLNGTSNLKILQNYALSKINADRLSVGLNPVSLSDNKAAQHHAVEIQKSELLSHWSKKGLKPYMLYSLHNGTGYVQQNIGQISYVNTDDTMKGITSHSFCTSDSKLYCEPLDPFDAIDKLENSMMYNDFLCCHDGHKNNILDKLHTNVSIGIAFNEYYFVLVQNFENNYLKYNLSNEDDEFLLEAKMLDPKKNLQLSHISFYFDNPPNPGEYEENKNKFNYSMGNLGLIVSKPLDFYEQYVQPESYRIIEAENWDIYSDILNILFKLPDDLELNDRMVTMVVYANNKTISPSILDIDDGTSQRQIVPLTSYTIPNKSVPWFE
jgi:hypothetical protein